MNIIIAGGSGLVGTALMRSLSGEENNTIILLTRNPDKLTGLPPNVHAQLWDGVTSMGWAQRVEDADVIINLAGDNLADGRWTTSKKKMILDSRLNAAYAVNEAISKSVRKPDLLIQASAVGYYGTSDREAEITESNNPGNDFLARVCSEWENAGVPAEAAGVRRIIMRLGVVLSRDGGAFPKLSMPFRLFAGGPVGSGNQWMPWIHIDDLVGIIRFAINNSSMSGPYNLTAPQVLRNRDFAKALGKAMFRPSLLPVPGFVLQAMLGEMSELMLEGQRAVPDKLIKEGYQFLYPNAKVALESLV